MMQIDHVVYGVQDLEAAASRLRERFGLHSVPGGVHPAWGTGNRIVPLGPSYVELLGVMDPDVAGQSFLGRELQARTAGGDRLMGWCVRTSDLGATATRLGLEVASGQRVLPTGEVLRWRSAGLERAMAEPTLPFFITWDVPEELHPGRADIRHGARPMGITQVLVAGSSASLRGWIGDRASLPIRVEEGPAELRAVIIATDRGDVELR
jgi:hypothetical protein